MTCVDAIAPQSMKLLQRIPALPGPFRSFADAEIEPLIDPRAGKRDERIPVALQLALVFDDVLVMDRRRGGGGRGVRLERRLRDEYDPRAAGDPNRLAKRVAGKDARPGAAQDHVRRIVEFEGTADTKRRLGVGVREDRAAAAHLEGQLEAGVPADGGRKTDVGGSGNRVIG